MFKKKQYVNKRKVCCVNNLLSFNNYVDYRLILLATTAIPSTFLLLFFFSFFTIYFTSLFYINTNRCFLMFSIKKYILTTSFLIISLLFHQILYQLKLYCLTQPQKYSDVDILCSIYSEKVCQIILPQAHDGTVTGKKVFSKSFLILKLSPV